MKNENKVNTKLRVGDKVRVMSGEFQDHEGKILKIDRKKAVL